MWQKLAIAVATALIAAPALAEVPVPPPVAVVVDGRLPLGAVVLPIFFSRDWSQPLPAVRRVVVVVHGYERNAADYARDAMQLGPPGDTLVIVPQFLAVEDIAPHQLPDSVLRWQREMWADGDPAEAPSPLSAFDAIDALLATTGNRHTLPNVTSVVLAGFSAGGQLVQRYAIVGRGEAAIGQAGIGLRYVLGSPSSFAYMGDERPRPTVDCPQFDRWKYGFAGGLPPYVAAAAAPGLPALERRFAGRDVTYLVGANDDNPDHRFLDKSCAGEVQGPTRLARMTGFFDIMRQRDGTVPNQRMRVIDGAAHNAAKVLGSPCGRAALFEETGCPDPKEAR